MLVPLLVRGMADRATAIKRKTAVITDNMAKLVDDPVDAAVFLPRLLPGALSSGMHTHHRCKCTTMVSDKATSP